MSAAISFLSGSGTAQDDSDHDSVLVYDVLERMMLTRGVRVPPLAVVRRGRAGRSLVQGSHRLVQLVRTDLAAKKPAQVRVGIELVLRLTARRMRRAGVPVSAESIAFNLGKCSEWVDLEFPGYRENGLLPVLLKMRQLMDTNGRGL